MDSVCRPQVALSSLRFQVVLTQVKNIHFYANGKAAGNSVNQSNVVQRQNSVKKKLPGTPLTKIETFAGGRASFFPL